jgi:hypothetical protein
MLSKNLCCGILFVIESNVGAELVLDICHFFIRTHAANNFEAVQLSQLNYQAAGGREMLAAPFRDSYVTTNVPMAPAAPVTNKVSPYSRNIRRAYEIYLPSFANLLHISLRLCHKFFEAESLPSGSNENTHPRRYSEVCCHACHPVPTYADSGMPSVGFNILMVLGEYNE